MLLEERIGAHPTSQGCFFRVWAPHAERVRVRMQHGDLWRPHDAAEEADLDRSPSGYWSATVPGIGAGTLYRFEITSGGQVSERLDPAARDVVSSALTRSDGNSQNASIVVESKPYPWESFSTPAFENFLIYQMHIGSFAGRNDYLNKPIATFVDVESKFDYIRSMGFNAIEPLPISEFAFDRSWGYNPAAFFAPESAYGTPADLKHFVNAAHGKGLAVIFDVVYNHAGPGDNVLWQFDGYEKDGGIYFEGGSMTPWGRGPAWWKWEVQDFFYQNARMYFEEYHADGLRFDATTMINGNYLRNVLWRLRQDFPDKYLIAEHLPAHPWIITAGNFNATWHASAHHETQRALVGDASIDRLLGILDHAPFEHSWNLVNYLSGSHDDIGDSENGDAEHGHRNWDHRHRYLVDLLGGRHNSWARAKCRLAWALNATMPGTPMCFMGSECLLASPHVAWGYWHDGVDQWGDHRFDWRTAGDALGLEMRELVAASNAVRWENPALRSDDFRIVHVDRENNVLAFVREFYHNKILVVVNVGDRNFTDHNYEVPTGGLEGAFAEVLCSQDERFGGWQGAGNAGHFPTPSEYGRISINLPQWSVVAFKAT
ncbi:alpha-amylase family glycosyl hydrolase [Aeoliella sp. ICT_H6.2]|uniref:1,4-alpha-glucan branching enzyme n=1 Tax=Aeoliella straminimaris TaxID=2954799 RepID=A0A9X2JHX8_9BACT|nr:alpha-amylase family glycosyl hydrolase [Aeoliella straminimaris]MCO6045088.1 alpha-amylase family glycosyl hydrolase [Aeoliella straminimaris]